MKFYKSNGMNSADRKKASEKFAKYMNTLSIKDHEATVNTISQQCFVPRTTIYAWKNCSCGIQKIYQVKIEEILGVKIFD